MLNRSAWSNSTPGKYAPLQTVNSLRKMFLNTDELWQVMACWIVYINKSLFIQLSQFILQFLRGICKNYKIKCCKLSNINSQKKVYANKIETVGHNNW